MGKKINTFDINYREYTIDGRFVSKASFMTIEEEVVNDIINIFETNETSVREVVEHIYRNQGLLGNKETLKDIKPTNISVRDPKTGRFRKWSDF